MPRVPLPSVGLQSPGAPNLQTQPVVPFQPAQPQQTAQMAEALGRTGSAFMQVAKKQQAEYDVAKAKEADSVASEQLRQMMSGETGYLRKIGADAMGGARKSYEDQMEQTLRNIEDGLDNDDQKQMFREQAQRRALYVRSRFDEHEYKQTQTYSLGRSKVRMETSLSDAVDAYGMDEEPPQNPPGAPDAGQLEGYIAPGTPKVTWKTYYNTALNEANSIAAMSGMGPEERDQVILGVKSEFHTRVVERMLDTGKTREARQYLNGVNPEEITADAAMKLRSTVDKENVAQDGLTVSTALLLDVRKRQEARIREMAKATGQPQSTRPDFDELRSEFEMAAMAAAERGELSGQQLEATLKYGNQRIKNYELQQASMDRKVFDTAVTALNQNPTIGYEGLPRSTRVALETAGLRDKLLKSMEPGRSYDPAVYARALATPDAVMANIPRDKLYLSLYDKLSSTQLNAIMSKREAAGGSRDAKHLSVYSNAQRVDDTMRRLGIDPKKNPDGATDFLIKVDDAVRVYEAKEGAPPDQQELQAILDRMVTQVGYLPGTLWGYNPKPLATMTPEEKQESSYLVGDDMVQFSLVPPTFAKEIARRMPGASDPEITTAWVFSGRPATPDAVAAALTKIGPDPSKTIGTAKNPVTPENWQDYDAKYRAWALGGMVGPEPINPWNLGGINRTDK